MKVREECMTPLPVAKTRPRFWSTVRGALKNPITSVGLIMTLGLIAVALAAPWIATYDPIKLDPKHRLVGPSSNFWLGTDDDGRDIFSRIVYGSRYSLLAAIVVLSLAATVGTAVGLVAGR